MLTMFRRIIHLIRISAVGSSFVFFFVGGWILSWLVLPLVFVGTLGNQKACRKIVQRAFGLFHAYMRWWRLMVYDPWQSADLPTNEACIIIANHPTLVDVTAIMSRYGNICCFVKGSLFSNIATGPLLRCCGHISANDGTLAIQQALHALQNGTCILIFPEGTRSPPNSMGPFAPVAFRLAAKAGVPICALRITTSEPALGKQTPWYRFPPRPVSMSVQPLMYFSPVRGRTKQYATQLAKYVQAWYNC